MSMRRIYRKIARAHGVSIQEVKRDMQAAIDHAYRTPPADGVTPAFQEQVLRKGDVPTPDEVIRYATGRIHKKAATDVRSAAVFFLVTRSACELGKDFARCDARFRALP